MGLGLGIISTAHINRLVIPGAHASDKVDLIAIASRDQGRAEEYARKWEIERAYGSYEALLEDADVGAVYISLPNTMHCEWSIRALEAGKHVLCEKPMANTPADCEQMIAAAKAANKKLMIGYRVRYEPYNQLMIKMAQDSAEMGPTRMILADAGFNLVRCRNQADLDRLTPHRMLGWVPLPMQPGREAALRETVEALRHQPEVGPEVRLAPHPEAEEVVEGPAQDLGVAVQLGHRHGAAALLDGDLGGAGEAELLGHDRLCQSQELPRLCDPLADGLVGLHVVVSDLFH